MLPHRLGLLILFDFTLFLTVYGAKNITVDDSKGDGIPSYTPRSEWEDQECGADACWVQPDKLRAHQGTWTAATYNPGKEATYFDLNFEGTAVYIYFIIPNTLPRNPTTATKATFILDGQQDGQPFTHNPDSSNTYLYDQLAYSKQGLKQAKHTLRVGIPDKSEQGSYWIGFDYAIITVDDTATTTSGSPTSTSTNKSDGDSGGLSTGAIVGAAAAGVVGLAALLGIAFILYRKRKQKQTGQTYQSVNTVDVFGENTPHSYQGGHGRNPSDMGGIPLSATTAGVSYYGPPGPTSTYSHGYHSSNSEHDPYYDPYAASSYAASAVPGGFSDNENARQVALRDQRQRELESQVQQMREQLGALQGGSVGAVRKQKEADEQEKEELKRQVQEMQGRIQQMEAAQNSAWAQGYSDEPPPGYTPTAST